MKKALSILLSFLCLHAVAQTVSYQWSPVFDYEYKDEEMKMLAYDETGFYLIRSGKATVGSPWQQVEKYNPDLSLAYKTPMDRKAEGKRDLTGFISPVVVKGKVHIFFWNWADESKTYEIIASSLDAKGKMEEETVLGSFATDKLRNAPDYKIISSPDGSKIAAVGVTGFEKGGTEKWHVLLFSSEDNKIILDKIVETGVPRVRFETNDFKLTNSGQLYSFKQWEEEGRKGKIPGVVIISPKGKATSKELPLTEKSVGAVKTFINPEGLFTVTGFYDPGNKNWGGRFGGHFYYVFKEDGNISVSVEEALGTMVLSHVYGPEKAAKEEMLKDYKLTDMVNETNGELTFMLEKFDETKTTSQGKTATDFITDYDRTHKETILIRLDKDGKKKWAQMLRTGQKYKTRQESKYWGGVVPVMSGNTTYLVWNHIDFPTITGKAGLPVQGWKSGDKKRYVYEEYGDRAFYPTCLSGVDEKGELLFSDQPVKNALPMVEMYKKAVYKVTFSSRLYARHGNTVVLLMEMPGGAESGYTKYQFCKVTVE